MAYVPGHLYHMLFELLKVGPYYAVDRQKLSILKLSFCFVTGVSNLLGSTERP